MSKQWEPIAHHGEFGFQIVTETRARQDGVPLSRGRRFFGVINRDGEEPVPIQFESLTTIARFVRDMKPHTISLLTGAGEDPVPLQRALDELFDAKDDATLQ